MTRSTSILALTVILSILLTSAFQATANIIDFTLPGGPRTVVQGVTQGTPSLEVSQPDREPLEVTVVDENGNVIARTVSNSGRVTICTAGWAEGEYIVQSTDADADYQEETITID